MKYRSMENKLILLSIDGWMICDLKSFLTVFQSYQDDGMLIMKGCVQWNSIYGSEDFALSRDRTRSARSNPLSYRCGLLSD